MKKYFRYFLLFTTLMFYGNVSAVSLKQSCAGIESLIGKVEIKRAGTYKWHFAKKEQKLYDNDMIRTNNKASAQIKYKDGSLLIVKEKSQILLNSGSDKKKNFNSKFITTFFGAVFFVIQEAIPQKSITRVYTPTSVVSIRGTSFLVSVDAKTGLTDVKVINGTVLVKNWLMDEEFYVKGGTKTKIALRKTPSKPTSMSKKDIKELQQWVMAELIKTEQEKNAKKIKSNIAKIKGNADDKILVMELNDISGFTGNWKISSGLTEMIASKLKEYSNSQIVISKTKDEKLDADQLGKNEKARIVIGGEIETFELSKRAAISVEANQYKEGFIATVWIVLYIVNPVNGTLVKTIRISEDVKADNELSEKDLELVGNYNFDMKDENLRNSVIGEAIEKVLSRCVEELSAFL